MLACIRKWWPRAALALAALIAVAAICTSPSYQSCKAEHRQHAAEEQQKKGPTVFIVGVIRSGWITLKCSVESVDEIEGFLTLLATVAIAFFTLTIWRANRNQLDRSREIERAYLVGGGGVTKQSPHIFVLDVANYGKTPASMKAFAVEICDREEIKLPNRPKYLEPWYKRKTFIDEIAAGDKKNILHKLVPDVPNPIVYGRFWFQDIWRQEERHFSFILAVKVREGASFGTHPDIDLEEIDPEFTSWK
jgi:hypothetical protein